MRIEDLPSYSKSDVELETIKDNSFLLTSAEPSQLPSHRANEMIDT